ncbi:MAG: ComEC/Rec2 family competence protein [Lachnospirales bacterium]
MYPIVLVFLYYILGILINLAGEHSVLLLFVVASIVVLTIIFKYFPTILLLVPFFVGYVITSNSVYTDNSQLNLQKVEGIIYSQVGYKNFTKLYIKTDEYKLMGLVNLNDDFQIGDIIKFEGEFQLLEKNEYKEFLYERSKGIDYKVLIRDYEIVGNTRTIYTLREDIKSNIYKIFNNKDGDIVTAMTIGIRNIHKETEEAYKISGMYHIIAISGLHIGILVLLVYNVLSYFFIGFWNIRIVTIVTMLFIFLFAFFTGGSASTIRAATMTCITLLPIFVYRKANPVATLFGAGVVILVYEPLFLFTSGFILSFLAAFGIITCTPIMIDLFNYLRIRFNLKYYNLDKVLSCFIAVFLLTTPYMVYAFGYFYPYSIFANMLLIPFITILVFLCFLVVIFSFLWMPLASILAVPVKIILKFFYYVTNFFGMLPYSTIKISASIKFLMYYYLALGIVYILWYFNRKKD